MRVKYHDNLLLPLNSGRMNQVASTGIKTDKPLWFACFDLRKVRILSPINLGLLQSLVLHHPPAS
jgi:hypothetical protein